MKKVLISLCAIIMLIFGGVTLSACGKETERVDVGIKVINEMVNTSNTVVMSGIYKGEEFTENFQKNGYKRVDENTDIYLTAQPAPGYSFAYWLVDDDIYSTSPTINYNEEHEDEFVAHFIKGEAQTVIVSGAYLKEIPLTVVSGTIGIGFGSYTITATGTGTFAGWTMNGMPFTAAAGETFELTNTTLISMSNQPIVFAPKYTA